MRGNYLKILVSLVQNYGVNSRELLAGTHISPHQLQGQLDLKEDQFILLCQRAIELTGDSALGLRFGQGININTIGVLGYALMSSATIADVLQILLQYHRMVMPTVSLSLTTNKGAVALGCRGAHLSELEERFMLESFFAAVITCGRFLINNQPINVKLELDYSEPSYADIYAEVFGFPVSFNCPERHLLFHPDTLALPLSTANPAVEAIFLEQCNSLLPPMGRRAPVASRVQQILLFRSGDFPGVEQVAKQLFMSERTLRRRLKDEETSFQQVLDQVRYQLATEYLTNTQLPVTEVARLVGFSDATNFRRSFKRWSGTQPSALRQNQLDMNGEGDG